VLLHQLCAQLRSAWYACAPLGYCDWQPEMHVDAPLHPAAQL
jgi:hypothetical protein